MRIKKFNTVFKRNKNFKIFLKNMSKNIEKMNFNYLRKSLIKQEIINYKNKIRMDIDYLTISGFEKNRDVLRVLIALDNMILLLEITGKDDSKKRDEDLEILYKLYNEIECHCVEKD